MRLFTHRNRSYFFVVLLVSILPRLAHAEDLKAVGVLFHLALLAAFAFAMAIGLLIVLIRLLVKWKRLSVQERWLWAGGCAAALALTANVLQKGLGSL